MPRYKIEIEYDGTGFHGFQKQDGLPTIEQALEAAAARFCGHDVAICVSGRTDAGVHAIAQAAHLDFIAPRDEHSIMQGINFHLRKAGYEGRVAVTGAQAVADDFHARFDAVQRGYIYKICNRYAPPVLARERMWHFPPIRGQGLDIAAMEDGARGLLGTHDFTSFRTTECQANSPMRTLDELYIKRDGAYELHVKVRAKSFLHHMVRNIVGTLVWIGSGKMRADDIPHIIEARKRDVAGPTAPACGLYFEFVRYKTGYPEI